MRTTIGILFFCLGGLVEVAIFKQAKEAGAAQEGTEEAAQPATEDDWDELLKTLQQGTPADSEPASEVASEAEAAPEADAEWENLFDRLASGDATAPQVAPQAQQPAVVVPQQPAVAAGSELQAPATGAAADDPLSAETPSDPLSAAIPSESMRNRLEDAEADADAQEWADLLDQLAEDTAAPGAPAQEPQADNSAGDTAAEGLAKAPTSSEPVIEPLAPQAQPLSDDLSETEWANLFERLASGEEGELQAPLQGLETESQDALALDAVPAGPDEPGQVVEAGVSQDEILPDVIADEDVRVRIAMLFDGPWSRDEETIYELENEVLMRVGSKHGARFPIQLRRHGGWSRAGVDRALDELLVDEQVDMIVAFGPLASNAALWRPQLEKPVIAPIVLAPYFQRAPLHEGSSGRQNLTYLGAPRDLVRDLESLREVAPFKNIGFLLSQNIVEAIPTLLPAFTSAARELDIDFKFYPLRATASETLASLDPDLDAVYVGPLSELENDEFDGLLAGLIERQLPSFSYWGLSEVASGLMVGRRGEQDRTALYARIADQVDAILDGQPASELPVLFDTGDRLSINMATARAVGVRPDWAVLTGAELLNEAPEIDPRNWNLSQAMRWAGLANRDVLTSLSRVAAGEQGVYGARSGLYPRVTVAAKGLVLDDEGGSPRPERQLLGFLRVRQVLYDERVLADYDIEKWLQEARSFEHEALVLDVQFLAAEAYLNLLRAKTIERVRRDDLALSRSNLELVELRRRNGAPADSDKYRWRNRIAVVQRRALDAQARLRQAELGLNRLLHRPLDEPLLTAETGLDDPGILMAGARLEGFLQNPWSFDTLAEFAVQESLANAPELRAIEASIAAADRDVDANRRAYWMPRLTLDGDVTERISLSQNGGFNRGGDTSWNVALNASFDIYAGGSKAANLRGSRHEMLALRSLHTATAERVEESVRGRMFSVTASYPGIDLSNVASVAAQRNLEIVRKRYTAAEASVVEMLDAQDAKIEAQEMTANAVFEFLLDLMSVQRASGRYDYFMSPEERNAWFTRLDRFSRVRE